jgi:FtsZ-binding cell division protein ZapB
MNLLSILERLPWWAWVLVGLAILYLFNVASGSIYSRKLWTMLYDQIVQEDKAIQEELEKEITHLDQREKELVQENARIKKQLAAAQEEKRMLLGRLHEIETCFFSCHGTFKHTHLLWLIKNGQMQGD